MWNKHVQAMDMYVTSYSTKIKATGNSRDTCSWTLKRQKLLLHVKGRCMESNSMGNPAWLPMPKVRHTAKKEQTLVLGDREGRTEESVSVGNRGPNPMTGNKPLPQPLSGAPRLPVAILDHRGKRKEKEVIAMDLENRGTVAGEGKIGEEDKCNEETKGVV